MNDDDYYEPEGEQDLDDGGGGSAAAAMTKEQRNELARDRREIKRFFDMYLPECRSKVDRADRAFRA